MARQNLSSLNANLSPVTRDGRAIVSVFQIPHSLTIWYSGKCSRLLAIVFSSLHGQQLDQILHVFFVT
jgi:hypothetical protein